MGLLRFAGVSWFVIGTGIFSVPDLFSLRLGHFGFFIGAVVLSGIICAGRKPNAAGALFGLLCIKPQAALLAPIILLARLQWRALLTGGAVVAGMCGAAAALFGVASWRAYFANGIDSTRVVLVEPLNSTGISIFWMLRSLDFGVPASFDGQAFAALLAAGGCFYIWRRKQAAPEARTAITVFLMLLTSPYGYINDMCGYCMAVALLAEAEGRITLFDMLLWLAPAICMNVGESLHVIIMPIFVLAAIFRVARSSREDNVVACAGVALGTVVISDHGRTGV